MFVFVFVFHHWAAAGEPGTSPGMFPGVTGRAAWEKERKLGDWELPIGKGRLKKRKIEEKCDIFREGCFSELHT